MHHPVVGDLTLSYETMELTADADLTLGVFTAEPGSKSEEALNLLASWAATVDEAESAETAERTQDPRTVGSVESGKRRVAATAESNGCAPAAPRMFRATSGPAAPRTVP